MKTSNYYKNTSSLSAVALPGSISLSIMITPNKLDILSDIVQSVQHLYHSAKEDTAEGLLSAVSQDPFSVLFAYEHGVRSPEDVTVPWFSRGIETIVGRCKIISFSEWASFNGVSDVWDRFREQVVKPVRRNDIEFIFYLGNASLKPSYEVDEILDIISDFSQNGRVTLVLTNKECTDLWNLLTGKNDNSFVLDADGGYKGQYIFNAMKIHRLLVYSPDHRITIFSNEGRQEWKDRGLLSLNLSCLGRDDFNTGYIFGLLSGLKTVHCTALGLALARASLRNETIQDLPALLNYFQNWITELDRKLVES